MQIRYTLFISTYTLWEGKGCKIWMWTSHDALNLLPFPSHACILSVWNSIIYLIPCLISREIQASPKHVFLHNYSLNYLPTQLSVYVVDFRIDTLSYHLSTLQDIRGTGLELKTYQLDITCSSLSDLLAQLVQVKHPASKEESAPVVCHPIWIHKKVTHACSENPKRPIFHTLSRTFFEIYPLFCGKTWAILLLTLSKKYHYLHKTRTSLKDGIFRMLIDGFWWYQLFLKNSFCLHCPQPPWYF